MNELTDRPTPIERQGAPDCLVELAVAWLQRPLAGQTEAERVDGVAAIALVIAQMRHVPGAYQERERRRWIERVIARMAAQMPEMRGYEAAAQARLEQHVMRARVEFAQWREQAAPPFSERRAA